jgi:hypothetical protein
MTNNETMPGPQASNNPFSEKPANQHFVGRDEQLEAFDAALVDLRACSAGHMFVAGLDGTGKTSFLARLSDIARNEGFAGCKVKLSKPDPDPAKQAVRAPNRMSVVGVCGR